MVKMVVAIVLERVEDDISNLKFYVSVFIVKFTSINHVRLRLVLLRVITVGCLISSTRISLCTEANSFNSKTLSRR